MPNRNRETENVTDEEMQQGVPAQNSQEGGSAQTLRVDANFFSFPETGSVKGICNIVVNDIFAVRRVRVVEGSKGLFVSMPSCRVEGDFMDIAYPVSAQGRAELNEAVLAAYETQRMQQGAGQGYVPSGSEGLIPKM